MPKLSIAIPTLNRAKCLEETLDFLLSQIDQAKIDVEVNVCDNASVDHTPDLFSGSEKYNKVKYFRFDERVDIDGSFERAVSICDGDYILLLGDDDIPMPGFIFEVSKRILDSPAANFFYVNRIIGDENLNNCSEVPHSNEPYGILKYRLSDFIKEFNHWPGFVSCLIFSKISYENGKSHSIGYDGYNFLSRIYAGSNTDKEVIFICSPLILHRRGVQSWKRNWPRYWLVSMPRLLSNLETLGFTKGAVHNWSINEVSLKRFIIDSLVAKAYDYRVSDKFWKESRFYQTSILKKMSSLLIQFTIPAFFAKAIYSQSKKMTK